MGTRLKLKDHNLHVERHPRCHHLIVEVVYTVQLVYKDHPRDPQTVTLIGGLYMEVQ